MRHFSHSIFITEPDSVIRITKFQEFQNFLAKFLLICGEIPEITKNSEFLKFCDSDCRIRFSDENWVEKMHLTLILVEYAHNLIFCGEIPEIPKNSEFLEFCDSDYRIRFSDENWVGKMCHTLILVENAHNLIFLRRDSIDSKKSRILGILWF